MIRRWIKILTIIFAFFVLTFHLSLYISKHAVSYATQFNPLFYERMYGESQYVRTDPIQNLPDEYIYSLAAWRYVHGENPAIFNADQPPLGKYIIGFGILLFHNEKITTPIFVVLTILVFFVLCRVILKDFLLATIATTVFSFEKLLLVQMVYAPLLDIYQLFFILLSLLFAVLSFKKASYLLPTMIAVGLVMATKYFATGVVLLASLFVDAIIQLVYEYLTSVKKKSANLWSRLRCLISTKRIIYLIATTPIAVLTLLLAYLPAYWQGYNPRMILGVQHYIYVFHSEKIHVSPLDVWQLLLFNRWHVPWDNTIRQSVDWQITWPLITITSIIMAIVIFRRNKQKKNDKDTGTNSEMMQFMVVWSILYIATLMSANLLPRYVLPLLPSLYILSAALVQYIWRGKYFYVRR